MTFADRVVVMNGGRIEQIGRPRAKRERSPNQSVALMVPRGGLAQSKKTNDLSVRGTPESSRTITRLSAASVQPQEGADPTIF
jgi:ABC-type sugar transport system ATPase subunit